MTAVAGATFTASQFNQYVRDNLNATAPALASAAGQYFVATGANALAARSVQTVTVTTSETTTSTSYTDLTTIGPSVTAVTGTTARVEIKAAMSNSTANAAAFMSFAIGGASSAGANDSWAINIGGLGAGAVARFGASFYFTGLTPGSNQFTAKYKVGSGTGTFLNRDLTVMGF